MPRPKILHMVTPADNVSPFDANMAADAGYQIIIPHCGIDSSSIAGLVQDAIFSRPPMNAASTGMFIGGFDVNVASAMLNEAKIAMVPPFELSVFADPNGAFTTAAALIAGIDKRLKHKKGRGLSERRVKIFGGGPVGLCAAVLAKNQGAKVSLVRLTPSAKKSAAAEFTDRFDVEIPSERAVENQDRVQSLVNAEVVICTAKAGIQVIDKDMLQHAEKLLIAADVNAVPPAGIEGISAMDSGTEIDTNWGSFTAIGALGTGKIKYDVQHQLFKQMLSSKSALVIDLPYVYSYAADHV